MSLDTLVSLIISLCPPTNTMSYSYHNEIMTCQEYYINCIIGYAGKFTDTDIKRCVDEKKPI